MGSLDPPPNIFSIYDIQKVCHILTITLCLGLYNMMQSLDILCILSRVPISPSSSSSTSSRKMSLDVQATSDQWSLNWRGREKEDHGELGSYTAARYRRFRDFIEQLDEEKTSDELFGLLLSVESIRDELQTFASERLALIRLAQTGNVVHQLRRLHTVLDIAAASHAIEVYDSHWDLELSEERRARADWYFHELKKARVGKSSLILEEIESDAKAEEIMTMLKAVIHKFGPDSDSSAADELTPEELSVIKSAFDMIAERFSLVVMTLPTWFVLPFEFRSTFGMSTWGNDRLVPHHRDEERFIREVAGWSELNHPHVAKFLGACHVSDEWFVAHEKVRAMTEYAAVVEGDRQKVWERIYELGLTMQYMNERGYTCPEVKVEHLFCAQYEDRAVMFGIHLCDSIGRDDTENDLERVGDPNLLASADWIESLVAAIVIVLEHMTERITKDENPSVDAQMIIEAYHNEESTGPPCLDNHEWQLLTQLKDNESGEFLRVVDTLDELAEIHSRNDWLEYVPMLERQIETVTQIKEIKATLMGETIGQLLSKCQNAISAND